MLASATEAHEARHALDEVNPDGPPPPTALFEVMGESSAQFVGMADAELRAYLGELHDTGSGRCWVVAKMLRGVYGRGARRTPHFFATLTILRQLDPEPTASPRRSSRCCATCPTRSCAGASRPRGRSSMARRCCRASVRSPFDVRMTLARKDPRMSTPESAADVLDRELANTRRAGIVTAAAIAVASAGALDLIGALQLWSAVWLFGVYQYVPYGLLALGALFVFLGSRIYSQSLRALLAAIVLVVVGLIGTGAWAALTSKDGSCRCSAC